MAHPFGPELEEIYLMGSLRNPRIAKVAIALRKLGYVVYDDWYAAGREADDIWRDYELERGRTYLEALKGEHVRHVSGFDKEHLDSASIAVLLGPAGKSAHLELGIMLGQDKPGYILLDTLSSKWTDTDITPSERWDVMYGLTDGVYLELDDLLYELGERRAR